ncbi:D-xylose transport system substrate-binding protein [Lachnospiraceae bacterium]|nr:D-xylose transport system substrate-binding protein [Lachnospiraceae bacterium]
MKKSGGLILVTAVLMALVMSVSGCAVKSQTGVDHTEEASASERIQIGVTFDSFINERWLRDRDVFVSRARELGADVNVQNANGDVKEQIDQIGYFIDKKVDVIMIVAVDSASLGDVVKKAHDHNIRVISYDRLVTDSGTDLYVSFDNEAVGKLMANSIIDSLPHGGRILKITGPEKDHNVSLVNEGFDKRIRGHQISIVDDFAAPFWKSEEAYDYLNAHEEDMRGVQAIMCGNDALAGGVIQFLAENRMAGHVIVTGQDADLDACQRIAEGTQAMTVYKPIEELAGKAAECAVKIAKGEEIEDSLTISDGTYDVPYVRLEPQSVNRDNLDSVIIDSGFHMREDVYLHMER